VRRIVFWGCCAKTGYHNRTLTRAENCFLGLLWIDHVGKENKICADELAILFNAALEDRTIPEEQVAATLEGYREFAAGSLLLLKRDVRRMQNHLLMQHDHISILSKAGNGGGYWVADSEEEGEKFFDSFRQRGITGFRKASRGKKSVMVEMMTQLSFEFEDLVDRASPSATPGRQGAPSATPGRQGAPTAMAVVDAFLEKMLSNPERYSEDIRKLGRKFGSVLLPKKQVAAMQHKAIQRRMKN
jgi:hypothetical protein